MLGISQNSITIINIKRINSQAICILDDSTYIGSHSIYI
jgi:hypothetical protein